LAEHAKFSPSAAKRWINCPASIALSEMCPPSVPSASAAEGTRAHAVAEKFLKGELDGAWPPPSGVPVAMYTGAKLYRDTVSQLGGKTLIEERLDIKEDLFGTADCGVVSDDLSVVDYKYGQGLEVEAKENYQLMIYAWGLHLKTDITPEFYDLIIVQPRIENNQVKRWLITHEKLEEFMNTVFAAREEALTKGVNATIQTGDHCRWCPAIGICPAKKAEIEHLFESDNVDIDARSLPMLPSPYKLTPEELANRIANVHYLYTYLNQLKKFALAEISAGGEVPGYSIKQSLGNRKFTDEAQVVREFYPSVKENLYKPREVISPAQLEKIIGKGKLDAFTTRELGEWKLEKTKDNEEQDYSVPPETDLFIMEDDL